ncbi:MAG: hypothetical protein AB1665_09240 [Candidatus Thermoplasmatota archaeon]
MAQGLYLRGLKDELKRRGMKFESGIVVGGVEVPIAFPEQRLAVFVDPCAEGCGCQEHQEASKGAEEPWGTDPTKCQIRIESENHRLAEAGWTVVRFWEHDVDRSRTAAAERIACALEGLC